MSVCVCGISIVHLPASAAFSMVSCCVFTKWIEITLSLFTIGMDSMTADSSKERCCCSDYFARQQLDSPVPKGPG